ncbi:MAG: EAL domain-containing protein [Rouxiella aceris]|uniref:bifunctional diguanylate cyclase/phosphodiesterase n=1 Tax=Rouxiella aceris TaxID=2703884 RepID=UPI00283B4604|nr:EAL domain-containing protein [Rouxiella aceris]MDR3434418.1 EAL domain-containing protein [Rouxiella aceris]
MTETELAKVNRSQIAKKFVLNFVLLAAGMLSLAVIALIWFAHQQNVHQVSHSQTDAQHAINSDIEKLSTALKDYAFWDDAYQYAGGSTVDTDWAFSRDNIGPSLYNNYSLEGVFVLGADMQTRYALVKGAISHVKADDFITGDIKKLYEEARDKAKDEKTVHACFLVNGAPAIVYAALIKPTKLPKDETIKKQSILIFVDVLDPAKLHKIGQDFELTDLHTAVMDNQPATPPFIVVKSELGTQFRLQWSTSKPGDDLLKIVLPLFLITATIFGLFIYLLLRRAVAVASVLDKSQLALASSEERFRAVAEAASDWIWETDSDGVIIYLSERFKTVVQVPTEFWIGKKFTDLIRYNIADFKEKILEDTHKASDRKTLSGEYIDGQGRSRYCNISVRPIFIKSIIGGYRGTVSDITAEIEAKARIEHMSQHDSLTGLANRNYLHSYLLEKLHRNISSSPPMYVLSLDLDRFKPVNDTLGHSAGDAVLCEVASRLNKCIRENDLVARLGGDEFLIVTQNLLEQQDIANFCSRICAAVNNIFVIGEHEISLGVSIGVVFVSDNATTVEELIRLADIALYEAKSAGRNNWQVYAEEMNERVQQKRKLETDLRAAIRYEEFFLEFQPRFQIDENTLCGAEALIRWNHPVSGRLEPDSFIPIAEQTGLIIPLSDWVLDKACKTALTWPETMFVSINLSPSEFERSDIVSRIKAVLTHTGLAPHRLELEITESVLLEDAAKVLDIMSSLKKLGVRLSMDDFGTGYSSLSYLRTFPFDGIKIDRSFIADLIEYDASQAIIESIVGLGRALSMTVTAEGVETISQLNQLHKVKCDQAQGYFLGRPMSEKQFFDSCIIDRP